MQFEGRTMIPVIDDFVQRFNLTDFVIVADSDLLSAKNIKLLNDGGYKYIVGARVRNENATIKKWIISLEKLDDRLYEHQKSKTERLIVSYSSKRAAKDDQNRKKGIARLERDYRSGSIWRLFCKQVTV